MSDLSVDITGWDEFMASISEAQDQAQPLVNAALANSATRTQRNIRERAPHRTGSLQRSILTQVSDSMAIVTADEKYAIFVEEGTAPHDIYPKNKKALYWDGAFSPVKAVHHPGTKANPFFSTGVDDSSDYIQDQFTKAAERIITLMAGH